ncbi:MAG: Lrp/AsnC family transcriptional regulator [Gemmatimonadota bacterium]
MTYRDLDLRLIEALREDGRASIRSLAERLSVSPSTAGKRLDSLIARGVITGFGPLLDYQKLGFGLVAITKIKARGDALPTIVDALSRDRHLTHVYEITGDFDVLVIGRFRNEGEMNREIKRLLGLPGIEGTNTSVVLSAAKEAGPIDLAPSEEE